MEIFIWHSKRQNDSTRTPTAVDALCKCTRLLITKLEVCKANPGIVFLGTRKSKLGLDLKNLNKITKNNFRGC